MHAQIVGHRPPPPLKKKPQHFLLPAIAISLLYAMQMPAFGDLFGKGAVRLVRLAEVSEGPSKPDIF